MKTILIISIVVIIGISLIFITQYSKPEEYIIGDRKYTLSKINIGTQDYFKPGIYYQYNFSTDYREFSKPLDEKSIFEELVNNNIPIEEAWFKSYAGSCCPPGKGGLCYTEIVFPAFIVRLSYDDSKIEQFGFIKTYNPDIGGCAYSVFHYIFY